MKRRQVLAGVAGLATVGGAGCLAGGSPGGNDGDDPTTTDGGDPTTTDGDPTTTDGDPTTTPGEPTPRTPFDSVTVGTREGVPFPDDNGPHSVWVENDADESRDVSVGIRSGDETAFSREFQFPAGEALAVTLNEPASYELALALDGAVAGTVEIDRGWFDCNDSETRVIVDAEGAVDSTTQTTDLCCPGPTVAHRLFEPGEGECGTSESATVEFRDGAVHVEGAARTPTPCHDLALSAAEMTETSDCGVGADDRLLVEVTTDGRGDGVCADCVGTVGYQATVDFEHAYPPNVRVVHDTVGERRTITETSR